MKVAALPAADQRTRDLLRVDAEGGPAVAGPGAQLGSEVGGEDELVGLSVGCPVS